VLGSSRSRTRASDRRSCVAPTPRDGSAAIAQRCRAQRDARTVLSVAVGWPGVGRLQAGASRVRTSARLPALARRPWPCPASFRAQMPHRNAFSTCTHTALPPSGQARAKRLGGPSARSRRRALGTQRACAAARGSMCRHGESSETVLTMVWSPRRGRTPRLPVKAYIYPRVRSTSPAPRGAASPAAARARVNAREKILNLIGPSVSP
jgi:hypothetical protein